MSNIDIKYEKNPFIERFLEKKMLPEGKLTTGLAEDVITYRTNDQDHHVSVQEVRELDEEHFIKTFAEYTSVLHRLSKPGTLVLQYVLGVMLPNKGTVNLYIPQMVKDIKCSKPTIYKGLDQMILADLIAPSTVPSVWFINQAAMFKGNRFSYIKSYVRAELSPKEKEKNILLADQAELAETALAGMKNYKPEPIELLENQEEEEVILPNGNKRVKAIFNEEDDTVDEASRLANIEAFRKNDAVTMPESTFVKVWGPYNDKDQADIRAAANTRAQATRMTKETT